MEDENSDGPPLTFDDLGIRTEKHVNEGKFGKSRKWSDLEKLEWVFLILNGLALPSAYILSIYKLATTSYTDPDFVFALVLVFNSMFCWYYVVHGVLRERPYEVIVLVIATTIVVIYSIVNYSLGKKDPVKLARLILACLIGPFIIGLGVYISRLYYLSGNLIFRTVGANSALQNACKLLYFFYGLLKLDLQLGVSMVILILSTTAKIDTEDIVVLSVGGVFAVIWFLIGYFSARMEHFPGTMTFFFGSPLAPAYIIYKIIKSAESHRSDVLAVCTFVCSGLALLTHVIVIITMVFVLKNYGKGLKEKVLSSSTTNNNDSWPLRPTRRRTYGTDNLQIQAGPQNPDDQLEGGNVISGDT